MDQQWLTTLISKGSQLRAKTKSQLEVRTQSIRGSLSVMLKKKGLSLSVEDIHHFIEENSSEKIRSSWFLALNVIRAFVKGISYRVVRLSDFCIELLVPFTRRNLGEDGFFHEGVLVTAGIEAALILWKRNWGSSSVKYDLTETRFQFFSKNSRRLSNSNGNFRSSKRKCFG